MKDQKIYKTSKQTEMQCLCFSNGVNLIDVAKEMVLWIEKWRRCKCNDVILWHSNRKLSFWNWKLSYLMYI